MKFETRMWHPNVSSQTGAICLDILKDKWSPALTIKTALVSLQALLSAPEPDDPQDAEVANMFKSDKPKFERTAAEWTATYATKQDDTQKMAYLTGMGFPEQQCRAALQASGGDQQQALEALLSG
jgi:ubiquitin-conjugating enzyme (huntingtin interacting protein 2)